MQVEYFYMECSQIYLERLASQDPTYLFFLAVCFYKYDCVMRTSHGWRQRKEKINELDDNGIWIYKKEACIGRKNFIIGLLK